jgi:hypothetical protein
MWDFLNETHREQSEFSVLVRDCVGQRGDGGSNRVCTMSEESRCKVRRPDRVAKEAAPIGEFDW